MSVKVVLFASHREDLQCHQLDVTLSDGASISDLIDHLAKANGDLWRIRLTEENIRVAFDIRAEQQQLKAISRSVGAIAVFTG